MTEETKINAIYSTLKLMNENAIMEFLIKIESLNLNEIEDKTIILKYIDMIINNTNICKNLGMPREMKELQRLKIKFIDYLNNRTENELFN